jgi:hypothetical protein
MPGTGQRALISLGLASFRNRWECSWILLQSLIGYVAAPRLYTPVSPLPTFRGCYFVAPLALINQ